jgi:hypothetical protein
MKKNILMGLIVFAVGFAQSQNKDGVKSHSIKDYPEGAYYTLDDFMNKKVRPMVRLKREYVFSDKEIPADSIVNQIFFYRVRDTTKFNDVFAVSFQGNLYFQQRYLSKYALKGNKNEAGDNENSYHRVIKEGKFFYLEGLFGNVWTKGLAYKMGAGAALASNINKLKGVVFDFEKKGFDYIKNCDDFNLFLKEHNANEVIDCGSKIYNIKLVRALIDKIITKNQ